jgi:N6-adenosine-specific RNA methylase IME4
LGHDPSTCSAEEFERLHAAYVEVSSRALDETRQAWSCDDDGHDRKWCLPRDFIVDVDSTPARNDGKEVERSSAATNVDADADADAGFKSKRKHDAVDDAIPVVSTSSSSSSSSKAASAPVFPLELIQEIHDPASESEYLLGDDETHRSNEHSRQQQQQHSIMCEDCLSSSSSHDPSFISNCTTTLQRLRYKSSNPCSSKEEGEGEEYTFLIPPLSTFSLTTISSPSITAFHTSLRLQSQSHSIATTTSTASARKFHLILLDPPYPSRSIRRTHQSPLPHNRKKTYSTLPSLPSLRNLLLRMDLDTLMAPHSLIAIWITNKPSLRQFYLDPDKGLFAAWGVELFEEWTWLKITEHGEPVFEMEGAWRRPYEVLLLGRRRRGMGMGGGGGGGAPAVVKKRTILAVPDLHSRKPCLRELLEPLLLEAGDEGEGEGGKGEDGDNGKKVERSGYRALEVFARYLVAGWWSWGDECVKFNWEGGWRRRRG